MNIATSYSIESETKTAVQAVYSDLMTQLGGLVVYASIAHDEVHVGGENHHGNLMISVAVFEK